MDMAELLNAGCRCQTLHPALLPDALRARLGEAHAHLFSATPVFLSAPMATRIAAAVRSLTATAQLPAWRNAALAGRDAVAGMDFGPQGAFMGYDFHMTAAGPRLIEINTNAGGAYLHAAALQAHRACCSPMARMLLGYREPRDIADAFFGMFANEWRLQRGALPWRTAAIVDEDPQSQYLAPEFALARDLFESHGIRTVVCDPRELVFDGEHLRHAGMVVDLVYNRLTDFDLTGPANAALRAAFVAGAIVLTPHPRAHALHADKRNLITLSDDALLARWGAGDHDRAVIAGVVPRTVAVTPSTADALWSQRRQLFFKPTAGFGSRGAYRGDKLTRRVWDTIAAGGYVAQELVAPSERIVDVAGVPGHLKLDIRAYAYAGEVLLLAARMYAGQTTNFRTAGGGFAPVVVLPDTDAATCEC